MESAVIQETWESVKTLPISHRKKVLSRKERALLWEVICDKFPEMAGVKYIPLPDAVHELDVDNITWMFYKIYRHTSRKYLPNKFEMIRIFAEWDRQLQEQSLGCFRDFIPINSAETNIGITMLVENIMRNPCINPHISKRKGNKEYD